MAWRFFKGARCSATRTHASTIDEAGRARLRLFQRLPLLIGPMPMAQDCLKSLFPLAATALLSSALPCLAQPSLPASPLGAFSLELNRLDGVDGSCRVTLVEKNGTGATFSALKLDLVVFDKEGLVTKRVGVDAGPLKAGRTMVKTFELKELVCENVGRVLINDVLSCEADGIAPDACLDVVEPRSRASAMFDK